MTVFNKCPFFNKDCLKSIYFWWEQNYKLKRNMTSKKAGKLVKSKKIKKRKSLAMRWVWFLLFLCILPAVWFIFWPVLNTPIGKEKVLYVASNETFVQSIAKWQDRDELKEYSVLPLLAKFDKINKRVKSGAYTFSSTASQLNVILKLLRGKEDEINVTLSGRVGFKDIIGKIAHKLEPDSMALLSYLSDKKVLNSIGMTKDNVLCLFIPDTYRFYWDTDNEAILKRFHTQYKLFWNDERRKQADAIDLTPVEVSILASIVDGEALHFDEMPSIAGLYMNRLRTGMKLQADPTVKFALGDQAIKRLTYEDYKFVHPYNTYNFVGLPPGPITMPSKQAIEAVLKYTKHNYLFMVAKSDASGYHHFTKTFDEHKAYSKQYRNSLDARGVGRQ